MGTAASQERANCALASTRSTPAPARTTMRLRAIRNAANKHGARADLSAYATCSRGVATINACV
jgi:hypothetical protein